MKPVLGFDGEKPAVTTISQMPESSPQIMSKKRTGWIASMVAGVVVMVIASAVIVISMYIGAKLTRDSYKEVWKTFKMDDGSVVEEKIRVTENEVDIKVPNEMEVLFDFTNMIAVYRFINTETRKRGECYATRFNEDTAPHYTDDVPKETEVNVHNVTVEKWITTTGHVPKSMVSEHVSEMCKDTEIFWMEKIEGDTDGVVKRSSFHYKGVVCYYPRCYMMNMR